MRNTGVREDSLLLQRKSADGENVCAGISKIALKPPLLLVTEVLFHQGCGEANQYPGLKVMFVSILSSLLPPPNLC